MRSFALHYRNFKTPSKMEEQDKRIEELTAQLKQQAAQVQKVSAQLELSKAAPQTVLNNQYSSQSISVHL